MGDLDESPDGDDGRLDDGLQSPGDEVLHLGDVVGGTGDETGGGEAADVLHGKGLHGLELHQAHVPSGQGGHVGEYEPSREGHQQAPESQDEHLRALLHDDIGMVENDVVGDLPHVFGDLQVHPDLYQNENDCGGDERNAAPAEYPCYHCPHPTYIVQPKKIDKMVYWWGLKNYSKVGFIK